MRIQSLPPPPPPLEHDDRQNSQLNKSLSKMGQCESEGRGPGTAVLSIPLESIQSDYPIEAGLFSYPQRAFHLKDAPPADPASSMIELDFTADFTEQIKMSITAYPLLSPALQAITDSLQISGIFLDELNISKFLYPIRQEAAECSLFVRNFHSFDEHYLNIAYEINSYLTIARLQSPNLHSIRSHFVISPQEEVVDYYSHVAVLEPVECTLSMVLRNRRKEGLMWSFGEFCRLFADLVEGLSVMHVSGLTHNDIRPSNVYYSKQKQCFLLGSFSNIMRRAVDKATKNVKESNHYKDLYSTRKIARMSSLRMGSVDLLKSDVYSLGMTLLTAFYLCEPIDRKKCAQYNRALQDAYPYLAIIRQMICRVDQRKSIFQIKVLLQALMAQPPTSPSTPSLSPSEIEKIYSPGANFSRKRESLIAQGYKCLGMMGKWKQKLKELFMHQQSIESSIENARRFQQLAITSKLDARREKSMAEYVQAAEIYAKLGEKNFQAGCYAMAIDYFRHGLMNFQNVDEKQRQEGYLRLLVKLTQCEVISGYEQVDPDDITALEHTIQGLKNVDPKLYWEYTQYIYNIYDYYEDYDRLREMLARQRASIEGIKTRINILVLKRRIIRNNIKLALVVSPPHQEDISEQAKELLNEALGLIGLVFEHYQYYLLEHPLQELKMEFLQAKIHFIFQPTIQALTPFTIIAEKMETRLNTPSRDNQGDLMQQYAQFYIDLETQTGDFYQDYLKKPSEALKHYTKALQRGRDLYGDIYNKSCAGLLQRIGRANKSVDRFKTYLECNELALKIYRSIYGPHHKTLVRLAGRRVKEEDEPIDLSLLSNSHYEEASTTR